MCFAPVLDEELFEIVKPLERVGVDGVHFFGPFMENHDTRNMDFIFKGGAL